MQSPCGGVWLFGSPTVTWTTVRTPVFRTLTATTGSRTRTGTTLPDFLKNSHYYLAIVYPRCGETGEQERPVSREIENRLFSRKEIWKENVRKWISGILIQSVLGWKIVLCDIRRGMILENFFWITEWHEKNITKRFQGPSDRSGIFFGNKFCCFLFSSLILLSFRCFNN